MSHKNKHNKRIIREPRLEGVAPPQLLRDDFAALDAKTLLRCAYGVEELLLMQSVQGHSHMGHGIFYGKTYPNTSMDDIVRALRMDPAAVKDERQELIDEVQEFVERVIDGENIRLACNTEGEPLLRCSTLRSLEIDPHEVLQGLYVGGLRDDAEIRTLANKRYGVKMGYGKCYLVDQKVLKSIGLDGFRLAKEAHEDEISEFERAGLFAHNGDPHIDYMYVRYQTGPGASDDAAIVMAGKMLGPSAAVGCFLADAVDTLEKYVPEYSDQDSDIAEYIEANYSKLGLTKDDSVDLAYLCAIPYEMQGDLPDSSLRHLLQVDRKHDQSTLESHFAYVWNKSRSNMELDHGECTNEEFYTYITQRLESFKAKH